MSPSLRASAGLLALLAMTFTLVGQGLALTCLPTAVMSHATDTPLAGADTGHRAVMDGAPSVHDEGDSHSGHGHPCPFAPVVSQNCAPAASLPSPTLEVRFSPTECAASAKSSPVTRDLLLAAGPFHPPRA